MPALLEAPDALPWLGELPAIRTLRWIWDEHYRREDSGQMRWRTPKELPPVGERPASPYDPDVRDGIKRNSPRSSRPLASF
ncbi:hypothetical protein [Streptomyces sp. NPDC004721]